MRNTDTASPLSDGRNTLGMKLGAQEERGTGAWQAWAMSQPLSIGALSFSPIPHTYSTYCSPLTTITYFLLSDFKAAGAGIFTPSVLKAMSLKPT